MEQSSAIPVTSEPPGIRLMFHSLYRGSHIFPGPAKSTAAFPELDGLHDTFGNTTTKREVT
jgi:hypothetical protein